MRMLSDQLHLKLSLASQRMIIYPVPFAVRGIWSGIKMFLDPVSHAPTCIISLYQCATLEHTLLPPVYS